MTASDTPGRLTREQRFGELHSLRVWLDVQRLAMKAGTPRDVLDGQIAALNEVIEVLSPRGSGALAAEGETPPPAPLVEVVREWQAVEACSPIPETRQLWLEQRANAYSRLLAYPLPAPVAGEGETPAVLPGLSGAMVDTGPG